MQMVIDSYIEEYKEIPCEMMPTKFYTITLDGWKPITFACDDSNLNDILFLVSQMLGNIITRYKNTHAFTRPQFFWKPDGTAGIKVGLMELERYEEVMSNLSND